MKPSYELIHGDCLDVMRSMGPASVDMILCDLPYGTTACKWDTVIPFERLWAEYNRVIRPGGCIALFGSEPFASRLRCSNLAGYKYDWVWNKSQSGNPFLARRQPLKIHETISIFNASVYLPRMRTGRKRKKGGYQKYSELYGDQKIHIVENDQYYPVSIINFSNAAKKGRMHPTQKPVPLLEYLIETYTTAGQTVLDNCMGSGSTGVACMDTGRRFIGIELDPDYFFIAQNRIQEAANGH